MVLEPLYYYHSKSFRVSDVNQVNKETKISMVYMIILLFDWMINSLNNIC